MCHAYEWGWGYTLLIDFGGDDRPIFPTHPEVQLTVV